MRTTMRQRVVVWLAWSSVGVALLCALFIPAMRTANGLPVSLNQVIFVIDFLAFCIVGALLATRQPKNAIGWIFCAVAFVSVGAFFEQYAMYALVRRPGALPGATIVAWLSIWLGTLAWSTMLSFTILLFPNGRLPSPRWRPVAWFAAMSIALMTIGYGLAPGEITDRAPGLQNPFGLMAFPDLGRWLSIVEAPLTLSAFLASVVSLVVRYRWAHTVERQQIKWFVYATIILLFVSLLNGGSLLIFGVVMPESFFGALLTLLPISVGIAILRYRLFDIDLIIRRTLLYTLISLILSLLYFGSVIVFETLLRQITGSGQNQLVTVLSTLAIAALFIPLHRRMQEVIDRRFYRRKYNAEQVLTAFGATVRNETDLQKLSEQLVLVVQKTVQPTQVVLCLQLPPKAGVREVNHEASS